MPYNLSRLVSMNLRARGTPDLSGSTPADTSVLPDKSGVPRCRFRRRIDGKAVATPEDHEPSRNGRARSPLRAADAVNVASSRGAHGVTRPTGHRGAHGVTRPTGNGRFRESLIHERAEQSLATNPTPGRTKSTLAMLAVVGLIGLAGGPASVAGEATAPPTPLAKIRVAPGGRGFVTSTGKTFVPFGVTYFRPGTGWAPQVWKQFDAEATRRDFAEFKRLGGSCVRVFLSYGSFYLEPGTLAADGLAKFDRFLALAEEAGVYVHPTGPDHWEGMPEWARDGRYVDERALSALESFWRLFAGRYRGRNVIFAYDLLNEPEIPWDQPAMRAKWNVWLQNKYGSAEQLARAWAVNRTNVSLGEVAPPGRETPPGPGLLDYQRFREDLAEQWTRRQVTAIKSADPQALVTVGFIQWSVPVVLAAPWQYAGFRPERQAPLLDFLEIHFYPLARGFYEYSGLEDENRNLAYLESLVREVAKPGKPVVVAEFGWYGGGKLTIDNGRHQAATEDQQARWCRRAIETSAGWACGWLNWGFHDHPGARDVTELTGLLTADGKVKAWGRTFQELAARFSSLPLPAPRQVERPTLDWDGLLVDRKAMDKFLTRYLEAFEPPAPWHD
jgi:hypothetical protein